MSVLTIALDAMGGDYGPSETVPATAQALSLLPDLKIFLVGNTSILSPLLQQFNLSDHPRLEVIHASQSVSMSDRPVLALRHKTDSSMRVALELVKNGIAQACISAGNTGALMVMAMRVLGMIAPLKRPALCTSLPNQAGSHTVMLDLGSNIQCSADMLHQFAILGDMVSRHVHHIETPRISLLNVGAEMIKGSQLVQDAATLIQADSSLCYAGFVEGDELIESKTDVIVCDGFTGNIALKTAEGIARFFYRQLKSTNESFLTEKQTNQPDHAQSSLSVMHPDLYNGASLLGLNGIVIKSHGRAKQRALSNAILHAVTEVQQQLPVRISARFFAEHTYER